MPRPPKFKISRLEPSPLAESSVIPLAVELRNRYLVMRHGHSIANEQGLIVSSPSIGIDQFGLTETGKLEVRESIVENRILLESIKKIYASDFLRTRETAEIVASELAVDIEFSLDLRERFFGDLDGESNQNYEDVWLADARDATQKAASVESVQSVARRLVALVNEIDQQSVDQTCLLVSHGDPLQILLTAAVGHDPSTHRTLQPLATAEIRPLESRR